MSRILDTHFVCTGCGAEVSDDEVLPFTCPQRQRGGDHVLRRRFRAAGRHRELLEDALNGDEKEPFVRFRRLFHSWHVARARGMEDEEYVERVQALDAQVAQVDGRGFVETPLRDYDALAVPPGAGAVLVKNESGNVSGSHKARHLMQVAIWLEITEALGMGAAHASRPLAIASCGNAALAAAVVARALARRLQVFVPTDANAAVLERISALEAEIRSCPRENNRPGDPCMHAFGAAVEAGALAFGCQGPENGLVIEGGLSLGYEVIAQLQARAEKVTDVVVQVGGGALGSGLFQAFLEAAALELSALPRLHTVQTEGANPLRRAYERMVAHRQDTGVSVDRALTYAATHREDFMWPWESPPVSYATGILDDETYDWWALVEGMLRSGGVATVADEATLREAHVLAHEATGIDVCATGASGLAGLRTLERAGEIGPDATALLFFTGARR